MAAKKQKATLEELLAVLEDFNSFMFADEADKIPLEGMTLAGALKEVNDSAAQLEPADQITETSAITLEALGIDSNCEVVANKEEEAPTEISEETEAFIATVNKSRKLDDIIAIAKDRRIAVPPPFRKDIKKLKVYVVDKLKLGTTAAPVKKKAEPKVKGPKVTNIIREQICENEDITGKELADFLDAQGVSYSPSTISTMLVDVRRTIECLRALKKIK